ncbi:hypothetical protein SLA2020_103420 [Shorea laevis]
MNGSAMPSNADLGLPARAASRRCCETSASYTTVTTCLLENVVIAGMARVDRASLAQKCRCNLQARDRM